MICKRREALLSEELRTQAAQVPHEDRFKQEAGQALHRALPSACVPSPKTHQYSTVPMLPGSDCRFTMQSLVLWGDKNTVFWIEFSERYLEQ